MVIGMGRDLPKVTQPPVWALGCKSTLGWQAALFSEAPPHPQGRVQASFLEHALHLLVPPHPGALEATGIPGTRQDQPIWGLGQDLIFPFLPLAGSARTLLSQRIATSSPGGL